MTRSGDSCSFGKCWSGSKECLALSGQPDVYYALSEEGWGGKLVVQGVRCRPDEESTFRGMKVGPRFLETMGIRLIRGREFSARDIRPTDPQLSPPRLWS
jgi:hypothetical protein